MDKRDLNIISAVIPTYNRCPYNIDKLKYNPTWWASVSLSNQKNIGEIIFVDDGSTDYTEKVIKEIDKRLPIDIRYIKNDSNIGLGASRNKGVSVSKYDKLWFMDDDCVIIGEDVIPRLEHAFDLMEHRRVRVGSISLPVSGNSLESQIVNGFEIGKVDKKTGTMFACNSKFPKEYVGKENELCFDKKYGLLIPFNVEYSHAVFLCKKDSFQKVGGFPTPQWKNAHTEEAQFLKKLQGEGYGVYYLPSLDPSFRVFHCRYGDPNFTRIPYDFSVDGISFNEILKQSSQLRLDTGCRVDRESEFLSHVLSEMVFIFSHYNEKTGIRNLQTKLSSLNNGRYFPEVDNGLSIFREAVSEGIELLKKEGKIINPTIKYIHSMFLK